mgnify:CR=1 FL=1
MDHGFITKQAINLSEDKFVFNETHYCKRCVIVDHVNYLRHCVKCQNELEQLALEKELNGGN